MTMRREHLFAALCCALVAAVAIAGCTDSNTAVQPDSSGVAAGAITPADLAGFVLNASAYAESVGKDTAIAEFSKTNGQFSRGDLYIYAYEYNGTLLSDLYLPEETGKNRTNMTDARGMPLFRAASHTASNGGGFIAYVSRATEGASTNESAPDACVLKIGYVTPVGDSWWIGSDLDLSNLAGCGSDGYPAPVSRMITLLEEAVVFGREQPEEIALSEIGNWSGMFVDSEDHYVYAYGYNGTVLAHPYIQDIVGTNQIEREDVFGMKNVRISCITAQNGGGFIVIVWPNPAKEHRVEFKITCTLPVDGEWWVGSGVYLSEITRE